MQIRVHCILRLTLSCLNRETYPDTGANIEILDIILSPENLSYLKSKLQAIIDDNLGYSMIFDVVQTLKYDCFILCAFLFTFRTEMGRVSTYTSLGLFSSLAKETMFQILSLVTLKNLCMPAMLMCSPTS